MSHICTACGIEKSWSEFSVNPATGRPRRPTCKACHAEGERGRRAQKPKRTPGVCRDCGNSIADRGPQALLCRSCAKDRRNHRGRRAPNRDLDFPQVLALISSGTPRDEACVQVGLSPVTLWRRSQGNSEFATLLDAATERGRQARYSPCGSVGAYDRGCRCQTCSEAARWRDRQWRESLRGRYLSRSANASARDKARKVEDPDDIPHGITGRTNYLCKCDVCKEAARQHSRTWQRTANNESLDKATRHNQQWTGPEMEFAARLDLTDRQVAAVLGRTMWAVRTMRKRMRDEPSQQWLAGKRSKLH